MLAGTAQRARMATIAMNRKRGRRKSGGNTALHPFREVRPDHSARSEQERACACFDGYTWMAGGRLSAEKETLRWGFECGHILHRRPGEVNYVSLCACAELHDNSTADSASAVAVTRFRMYGPRLHRNRCGARVRHNHRR